MGNTISNCCQPTCIKSSSSQKLAFLPSNKPLISTRRSKKGKKKLVRFDANRISSTGHESSRQNALENGRTTTLENQKSCSNPGDDGNSCKTASMSSEVDLSFIEFIKDIKSLYTFIKKIGDGKFGTVFLAHPRTDSRSKVAIKLIPQTSFSHRIEKELALLKSIEHTNVINHDHFYIVTEY
jgi:hypothetical protein